MVICFFHVLKSHVNWLGKLPSQQTYKGRELVHCVTAKVASVLFSLNQRFSDTLERPITSLTWHEEEACYPRPTHSVQRQISSTPSASLPRRSLAISVTSARDMDESSSILTLLQRLDGFRRCLKCSFHHSCPNNHIRVGIAYIFNKLTLWLFQTIHCYDSIQGGGEL